MISELDIKVGNRIKFEYPETTTWIYRITAINDDRVNYEAYKPEAPSEFQTGDINLKSFVRIMNDDGYTITFLEIIKSPVILKSRLELIND